MNDAEKNAETVRRGYAAFNSADMGWRVRQPLRGTR